MAERGLDFYPTPECATRALIAIEGHKGRDAIPDFIWEPAAGDGAIVKPLLAAAYAVHATDIVDRGAGFGVPQDYLTAEPPFRQDFGIITNPPFARAEEFIRKALTETSYAAFLLRLSFLESTGRMGLFSEHAPSRVLVSSRRLPMMHREGWDGPKASSNVCYAWFVWDYQSDSYTTVDWFDWKDFMP